MIKFPLKEVVNWLYKEHKTLNPDIIVIVGERIFNMFFLCHKDYEGLDEIIHKVVDGNAIDYLDCKNKRILLIDDETEFGRNFVDKIFPLFENNIPKSVYCRTVFLANDIEAITKRKKRIINFRMNYPKYELFADALEKIEAYEKVEDCEKFHASIFCFRKFIKSNLNRLI